MVRFEPSDITAEMLDGAKANGCVFVDLGYLAKLIKLQTSVDSINGKQR